MQELAEGLSDKGYMISVVTSYPQYNLSEQAENDRFDEFSAEDGINILRIKTLPHHMVNFIVRGISQSTMPYIFTAKINKYFRHAFDIVIVYSPPLPLAGVGRAVKRNHGAKFILNIQDIFPQNAIDLGILKNNFLINYFRKMEKKIYEDADIITVHSEGNREFLMSENSVHKDKIHILHNWIDISAYTDSGEPSVFRTKFGLENKFIFLFAGVIGPSQGLDLIIEVARKLREIDEICFLLVGDGSEKEHLIKKAEEYGLANVDFRPFISKQDYQSLVKEVDVGVVCLRSENKTPVVPGKMLGYMAASIPLVAFLHKESDGHQVVRDAECGYSAISDDIDNAVEITKSMYNEKDRLKHFGRNGLAFARKHFSKDICLDNLEKLF
jgi:glycosyltransferase involved in cell wall biosynthesis